MADPTVLFNESAIDFLCLLNFGGVLCHVTSPVPLSRIISFFQ